MKLAVMQYDNAQNEQLANVVYMCYVSLLTAVPSQIAASCTSPLGFVESLTPAPASHGCVPVSQNFDVLLPVKQYLHH